MWQRAFVVVLLAGILRPAPATAAPRGTWNADLTCGGFPEEPCSVYIKLSPLGSTGRPETRTVACEDPKSRVLSAIVPADFRLARVDTVRLAGGGIARRVDPSLSSAWITSGAWMADGSLLLVDASRQQLLHLDAAGRMLAPVQLPAAAREIRSTADGFLVKADRDKFLVLDSELRVRRHFSLAPSGGVRGVFNWVPVGHTMLAFADVTEAAEWRSGWVTIPLSAPDRHEILRKVPLH